LCRRDWFKHPFVLSYILTLTRGFSPPLELRSENEERVRKGERKGGGGIERGGKLGNRREKIHSERVTGD
jgi:hypothetical protein